MYYNLWKLQATFGKCYDRILTFFELTLANSNFRITSVPTQIQPKIL